MLYYKQKGGGVTFHRISVGDGSRERNRRDRLPIAARDGAAADLSFITDVYFESVLDENPSARDHFCPQSPWDLLTVIK